MKQVVYIVFGASGDLAKRKIIPALYALIAHGALENFVLIGVAHDAITVNEMLDQARVFIPDIDEQIWQQLLDRSYYHQLNFTEVGDYHDLEQVIKKQTARFCVQDNRLVYLAAAASFYCAITQNLAASGIVARFKPTTDTWHRIVYEKPFGYDLASAHAINACITASFYEEQIYRIDHYLSKQLVSNIAMVRFTNAFFEPLWNHHYIDQVYITLSEKIGIESRGAFYDEFGVIRDVVQNHIMELLALTAMEAPSRLDGDFIRAERVKVIESLRIQDGILGQYDGYTDEKQVSQDSSTPTFALLKFTIDNDRWRGVPFYVKTGKCLDKKETAIRISFKAVNCLLARECPKDTNSFEIAIDPDGYFSLYINTKKPGFSDEIVQVPISFSHRSYFGRGTPQAYEVLLKEVAHGEQSASVRQDEIEYCWRIADEIIARNFMLYHYAQGSLGPVEIEQFKEKHMMRWII